MSDVFSKKKRSWIMSRIKGKDTKPELIIRSMVHRLGFRFRLHDSTLPGKPDIVLKRHKKVIFIHGCFWHSHSNCKRATMPAARKAFWVKKITGNKNRDKFNRAKLKQLGWNVLVIWQCDISTKKEENLFSKIHNFLYSK